VITVITQRAVPVTRILQRATGATVITQRAAPAVSVTTIGRRGPQGPRGFMGPAGDGSFTLLADRPLGGHRLIFADGAGGLDYADCTATDALQVLGMTLHAVAAGDEVGVRRTGAITESSWRWIPGLPVYLGRAGVPTQSLPAEAVISLVVGIPLTPTTLFMAPREPIQLI
jgi:hypothetical protein